MERDSPLQDDAASRVTLMRDLARLWVQSQPVISAYLMASVYDVHHAEDLVQEVAQVVAEKFTDYDRNLSFTSWALGIDSC
jgi:RNA polymerase sigma-70 factor, ECF subfamily